MAVPKPYSFFHLIVVIIGVVLAAGVAFLCRQLSEEIIKQIICSVGLLLIFSEIYKQIFYYVLLDKQYYWWIFPFQLCSIPMYLCLLYPFVYRYAFRRIIEAFLMTFGLLGGIAAFIDPSGFFTSYVTLTWHGILWHVLLIFLGCLTGFRYASVLRSKDYRNSCILFGFLCIAAELFNWVFHKYGSLNLFYISPWEPVTQIYFKDIAVFMSKWAANLLYLLSIVLGSVILTKIWNMYARKSICHQKHR